MSAPNEAATGDFCRSQSLEEGEPLAGSATAGVRTWLLVEHPGPWGARPPSDTPGLSGRMRGHLQHLAAADPALRVQLMRRPEGKGGAKVGVRGPRVIVVRADPHDPGRSFGVERRLGAAEEVLELDPEEELTGRSGARQLVEPHYFVCVHGSRDRCCAKWGMPLFRALAHHAGDLASERVWQVSHLGGHRFAPVVLTLPDGFMYGRLGPEDAGALWGATEAGMLPDLRWLRGRTSLDPVVQVAEHHLRAKHGFLGHNDLTWVEGPEVGAGDEGDRVSVRFAVTGGELKVELRARGRVFPVIGSCGETTPKAPGPRWEAVGR